MEQSSGGVSDDDGGEDRLSALPNDVLVRILVGLARLQGNSKYAARTSVLSRRWRDVWTLLPELRFHGGSSGAGVASALAAGDGPNGVHLRALIVRHRDASPGSLAAWLPTAARRVYGDLTLIYSVPETGAADGGEMEAEASQGGTIELPCFEEATSIHLDLGFLGLSMPPAGVFARLIKLTLFSVRFHGPGELGDALSSPRCPHLQELSINNMRGPDGFAINSESLQVLNLLFLRGMRQITVVAPALVDFLLLDCFIHEESQPSVSISAPQLKSLRWDDTYDQSSVDLGSMEHLETLKTHFVVYGIYGFAYNSACLMLLPRFEAIKNLVLTLFYPQEINHLEYLMEDLISLPNVTSLELTVQTHGHSFGDSSFHVLKFCSGIKRLILFLSQVPKGPSACSSSGCVCDQPTDWRTEDISLNHLEELELEGFGASKHEVAFVERLLNWVPVLKTMTVTFHPSITKGKAKVLVRMLRRFSRPDVRMKFYIYRKKLKVLLAPED